MSCAVAAVLVLGLMPTAAMAAGVASAKNVDQMSLTADVGATAMPSVGPAVATSIADGAVAGTSVFVDVISGFRLIEMSGGQSHLISAQGVQGVLDVTAGALFATIDGWAGNVSGIWTVGDMTYDAIADMKDDGTFSGRFLLPLSADGAHGSLRVEAPGYYECFFQATDSSGTIVSGTVWIEVLAEGQESDYANKTIYPVHDQTIHDDITNGIPEVFSEPSVTGSIHRNVVHLSGVALGADTHAQAWGYLQELASQASAQGVAYHLASAWSLEMLFDRPTSQDPEPYRGALSVVLPISNDVGIAAGDTVWVIGYDANNIKQPFSCVVRADEAGMLYIAFLSADTAGLGTFGIAVRNKDAASALKVIASTQGSGFINYEGEYTWSRDMTVRYVFTPLAGWQLSAVKLNWASVSSTDALVASPPDTLRLGYWDIDLSVVPKEVSEVSLVATFEAIPEGPDAEDPETKHTFTVEVEDGVSAPGTVFVNGEQASPTSRFSFGAYDVIELIFEPIEPSLSVEGATIQIEGQQDAPLAIYGNHARIYGISDDAHVVVRFSRSPFVPVAAHTVSLSVVGGQAGHGSIDAVWQEAANIIEATRMVADGASATFDLFPEPGYGIYTVMDGTIEIGSWLNRDEGSGFQLCVPDVHKDHTITVEFRKIEELPDEIPPEAYVTIQTESTVEAGSVHARPAIITPPSVVIPTHTDYSFYVIPANDQGALARVEMKGATDLSWHDITSQVAASWIEWPSKPEGTTSTGYYDLALKDVREDTFVRVVFRDREQGDPSHDPTPTRKVTINVKHEDGATGTVSPNTVGKPALVVPVGAKVHVVVICDDGSWGYVDHIAPVRGTEDDQDVRMDVNIGSGKPDGALGDGDTFEIPDSEDDQDITITFRPSKPSSSSSSSSSSAGSSNNSSSSGSSGSTSSSASDSSGSSNSSSAGSSAGSSGTNSDVLTVTPVVVSGQDGRVHGSVSPAVPVQVRRGEDCAFSFKAETGYRTELSVAGRTLTTNAGASYTLKNVQANTELHIRFVARTAEDSLSAAERPVHRLTSLARTGDLMPPLVLTCLAIAAGAAGIAFLTAAGRRRRDTGSEN